MAVKARKKFNREKLVQKAKEGGKTGGVSYLNSNLRQYRFHEKKNRLSIIPFEVSRANADGVEVGELWYKAQVKVHTQVGVNKQMIICPKMFNKKCPICEMEQELSEQGAEWDSKERQALRAKTRELYNVINMDKPEDGIQILEAAYNTFGKKLDAEVEDDEANGAFPDPDEGLIVVARGVKASFAGRDYIDIDKITFEERDALDDETMSEAVDLHAALKVLTYDEIVNLINGGEEDEAPKPKKSIKSKAKPVDEDEDEDEDEEEEAETRRPAPRGAKKKAEPEEEPDEDENEPETPQNDDVPFDEDSEESDEEEEEETECKFFGKKCGYDDDVCDDCDNWKACRKATDAYLKAKRSK